ncbi:MAG: OmpA family protein [Myxococcales bacterium]|nr:OmpA family protein [Myxococcales bacterium]
MSRQHEQPRQHGQEPATVQQGAIPQLGLAPHGNASRQADLSLGSGQCEAEQDESRATPWAGEESAPLGVVHFEHDSHQLDGADKDAMRDLIGDLVEDGCTMTNTTIRVEGFADRTGSEKHNQGLSMRRALAVAKFIERKSGLLVAIAEGWGEVDSDDLAHARRVDVWVDCCPSIEEEETEGDWWGEDCAFICARQPDEDHPFIRSTYRYAMAVEQAWRNTEVPAGKFNDEDLKPDIEAWEAAFKGWMSPGRRSQLYEDYEGSTVFGLAGTSANPETRGRAEMGGLDEQCPGCKENALGLAQTKKRGKKQKPAAAPRAGGGRRR